MTAPTPSQIKFRVTLPSRPELTFAIGIKPLSPREGPANAAAGPGGKARFVIRAGEDELVEEIFRRDIHPARSNRWIEQVVDLRRYAGRAIWLSFETSQSGRTAPPGGEPLNFVGLFADPVIHDRTASRVGKAVVLISIETLRRDHVSLYGYQRQTTPRLEDLAAEGIVFEDAISTSSWTLPAHGSLFTSLYPSAHGGIHPDLRIREGLLALPELLQQQGFFTQAIVTQIYLSEKYGLGKGFYGLHWMQEARAREVTDRAIAFLRTKHDDDIFLFLHYFDPHFHYNPPPPYDRKFDPSYRGPATGNYWEFREGRLDTISSRDLEHIRALYDGEILYLDHQLQRFFLELKRLNLFDDALIVVTSDHGEEFLDHGDWAHGPKLYEELIRIPLLFKLPGGEGGGRRIDQQVSLLDVAPTILDLIGLPIPDSFQGRSLLAELLGKQDEGSSVIWSEVGSESSPTMPYQVSFRQGALGRKLIFKNGNGAPPTEIYDLAQDPRESRNLSESEGEATENVQKQLAAFLALMAEQQRDTPPNLPADLAPEHLEQLRALGYVQ